MKTPSPAFRVLLLALTAAVLAVANLACGSDGSSQGVPVALASEAIWVGADSGLLQCQESEVKSLDDAVTELEVAGVASLGAQQGTPLYVGSCRECSCSALVYNFVAIDLSALEMAELLGFTVFEPKDVAFR